MIVRIGCRAPAQCVMRWASRVFAAFGCMAIAYAAFSYLDAIAWQSLSAHELETPTLGESQVEPLLKTITTQAKPLGTVAIPRLGLSVVVSEGIGTRVLRLGAGHIPGTALPGRQGNIGIAAHRDTFFRPLRRIRTGDIVTITTARGLSRYVVQWSKVVPPSDASVLNQSSESSLTLVTCYPFNFIGPAPERFVVRARKVAW